MALQEANDTSSTNITKVGIVEQQKVGRDDDSIKQFSTQPPTDTIFHNRIMKKDM